MKASPITEFGLTIPGEPRGQPRPRARIQRGGAIVYKSDEQAALEDAVAWQWRHMGSPAFDAGATISLYVTALFERPADHWRRDGTLTPEGERHPLPLKKPDGDNILKLIADALNGLAWPDDAQITDWTIAKRWCGYDDEPRCEVLAVTTTTAAPQDGRLRGSNPGSPRSSAPRA